MPHCHICTHCNPRPDGVRYEMVTVTPALAEKWLEQNTHNRRLKNKVYAYARDMEAGNWRQNGETVKFAADGTLLDGQHRLHAIGLSKVTVELLVVTGLERRAQETVDDGAKRTLSDALTLRGESNTSILAAVTRRAYMWTQGLYRNTGAATPTNTECLTFLGDNERIRESATLAASVAKPAKLPASVIGLTHWVFSGIDAADAAWFFEHLASGANLEKFHPVWMLRQRADSMDKEPGRVPEDMLLALVIKAWNAYRDGREMKLLQFRPGGSIQEKFPLPK